MNLERNGKWSDCELGELPSDGLILGEAVEGLSVCVDGDVVSCELISFELQREARYSHVFPASEPVFLVSVRNCHSQQRQ